MFSRWTFCSMLDVQFAGLLGNRTYFCFPVCVCAGARPLILHFSMLHSDIRWCVSMQNDTFLKFLCVSTGDRKNRAQIHQLLSIKNKTKQAKQKINMHILNRCVSLNKFTSLFMNTVREVNKKFVIDSGGLCKLFSCTV